MCDSEIRNSFLVVMIVHEEGHLHRYVVAGLDASAGVSDVLLELLQTVQHRPTQQLSSSGCSSDASFTWNRPQLLHTGTQPGQVTTDLLQIQREEDKEIKV